MDRKLIRRYVLLVIPFICGCLLYGLGSYGIVGSLLFFGGGYIFIKNIFDYRMINKNIKKYMENDLKIDNCNDNIGCLLFDRDKIDSENVLCNDIDNTIVKGNIDNNVDNCDSKYRYEYRKSDSICGLKSTRLHSKVRRKY